MLGWDRRENAVPLAKQLMVVGRVESGVQHHVLHAHVGFNLRHHPIELVDVRRWTLRCHHAQDRVAHGADNQHQLSVSLVGNPFFRPIWITFAAVAAMDVIAAGMAGIKTAGITGGVGHVAPALKNAVNRIGQELAHSGQREQPTARLLQRCPMGHALEADRFAQVRGVEQKLPDAAVVLFLELLEHEAGKEPRLRELLGTVYVGVVAEGFLAGGQRDHRHLPWRLAGAHVISNTKVGSRRTANSATRFLQSPCDPLSFPQYDRPCDHGLPDHR